MVEHLKAIVQRAINFAIDLAINLAIDFGGRSAPWPSQVFGQVIPPRRGNTMATPGELAKPPGFTTRLTVIKYLFPASLLKSPLRDNPRIPSKLSIQVSKGG
jgi:hypothetical protein